MFGLGDRPYSIALDEIDKVSLHDYNAAADLIPHRERLARVLRGQRGLGGVPRASLVAEGITPDICTAAIKAEWRLKAPAEVWPGMSLKKREAAAPGNTRHIRAMDRIWRCARDLLNLEDPNVVSGRLYLAEVPTRLGRVRVVRTRGIRDIAERYWDIPVMILDATLPDKAILEKWFPRVEIVDDIDVYMPHARVRQVLGAPITERKLLTGAGRTMEAISRYIAQRWIETGRQPAVVITQKGVEAELTDLPPGVLTAHFNAIEGLDYYKDVRLLITVGRTAPGPLAVEAIASALSGVEVASTQATGMWYDRVERMIGSAGVRCDEHPDPLAEAVRWQASEAGIIQAIGRGRGVNRTSATPLDIDVLFDAPLPGQLDRVERWRAPSLATVMRLDGFWLNAPGDMSRAWPATWKTRQAAKDWADRQRHGSGTEGTLPIRKYLIGKVPSDPWVFPTGIPTLRVTSAAFTISWPDPSGSGGAAGMTAAWCSTRAPGWSGAWGSWPGSRTLWSVRRVL
jgi:hypothetical protein